jgi:hypothetical protein
MSTLAREDAGLVTCIEWSRLMDRYCRLVQAYSEAVKEMRNSTGQEFARVQEHVERIRNAAQDARLEVGQHESKHRCRESITFREPSQV